MMIAANKQIQTDIELSSMGGQILAKPGPASACFDQNDIDIELFRGWSNIGKTRPSQRMF